MSDVAASAGPNAERQRQLDEDYAWWSESLEMQRRYGGQVLVVQRRTVWGEGRNLSEAWKDAQKRQGCPPQDDLTFVPIPLPTADEGSEFGWCLEDVGIQQRHGGLVAAVGRNKVWGAGVDRAEALEECRKQTDCPPAEDLICVLIPYVLPQDPV
jgi:hypothetical protein